MSLGAARAANTRQYQLLNTGTITSTGSQTYSIPVGTLYLEIEMWGAGGGGGAKTALGSGRSATRYSGAGGGGGAYLKKTYYGAADMQAADTLNFTIGAGGAGGAVDNTGAIGGATSLDTHKRTLPTPVTITTFSNVEAGGGRGGAIATAGDTTADGGLGGVATNGDINTSGNKGEDVASAGQNFGAAGGAGADPDGGAGGAGANPLPIADAVAGTQPGGGGGGGRNAGMGSGILGANGGDGKVIVKAYG